MVLKMHLNYNFNFKTENTNHILVYRKTYDPVLKLKLQRSCSQIPFQPQTHWHTAMIRGKGKTQAQGLRENKRVETSRKWPATCATFSLKWGFFLSYALKFWFIAAKSKTDSSTWQGDRQFPETWTGITSVKWVHNRDRLKHVPVTAKSLMGGKMSTWLSSILNTSHPPPRGIGNYQIHTQVIGQGRVQTGRCCSRGFDRKKCKETQCLVTSLC